MKRSSSLKDPRNVEGVYCNCCLMLTECRASTEKMKFKCV